MVDRLLHSPMLAALMSVYGPRMRLSIKIYRELSITI